MSSENPASAIPHLAHGWRSVTALPPGRKRLTRMDWTTLETCRMDSVLWQKLEPPQVTGMNHRKARAHLRHRLNYVAQTNAIKDAMKLLKGEAP
jgi:hypothetical protein